MDWDIKKSPANAKGNVWQWYMFEGPLQTKSKFTNPSNLNMMIFIHSFTYTRWCQRSCCCSSSREPAFWKGYLNLMPPYRGFFECRGPKFKLVKTTFSVKNFICRLFWSICSDFGTICSLNVCHSQKSPKNLIKTLFWHSRSFKALVPLLLVTHFEFAEKLYGSWN